jgi:hypothetical protein
VSDVGPTLDRRLAAIDREIAGLGTCGWAKASLTPELRAAAERDPERLRILARRLDAHAKECTICRLRDEAIERMGRAMDDSWGFRVYRGYDAWYRRLPAWLQPAVEGGVIMGALAVPNSIAVSLVHWGLTLGAQVVGLSIGVGIAIGLVHPGWVKTDMGGIDAPIAPTVSAAGIVKVIEHLDLQNAGSFWQWDGQLHSW